MVTNGKAIFILNKKYILAINHMSLNIHEVHGHSFKKASPSILLEVGKKAFVDYSQNITLKQKCNIKTL